MAEIRDIENFGVNGRTLEDINHNFNELKALAESGNNDALLEELIEINTKLETISTDNATNTTALNNIINKVNSLDTKLIGLTNKIEGIETKLTSMDSKLNDIITKLNTLTASA